jgi:hypothetical protein
LKCIPRPKGRNEGGWVKQFHTQEEKQAFCNHQCYYMNSFCILASALETHQLDSHHVITSISAAHLQPLACVWHFSVMTHNTYFSIMCFKKPKWYVNALLCDSQGKDQLILYTAVTSWYQTGIYKCRHDVPWRTNWIF